MVEDTQIEEKTDQPSVAELSEKEAQIIKQIEYYFGDMNLPRDKFLLGEIKADDGWVPLETMVKFNRLAKISSDFGEIAAAVKKSTSGLVEVNDDNTKIRRSPHMPIPEMNEERRKELTSRTAYIRRFPLDYKIADVLEFCSKKIPNYENVILRHYHDKAANKWCPKGSALITFKDVESCKKFIEGDDLEHNGQKMEKKWQKDYIEEKRNERLQDKMKHKTKSSNQKSKNGSANDKKTDDKDSDGEGDDFPLNAVVHLSGFKESSQTKRETIKEKIESYEIPVAFIDFNIGEQSAWVRMEQANSANKLAEKVKEDGGKLVVGTDELELRVLEGEEEQTYLVKAKERFEKRRHLYQKKHGRKGGRKGGRGRKRGGSPVRRESKRAKADS
ncbi:RNA Hypothetical protein motif [Nesidiocoris tenuis]|uniref:HTH La-type RNA-binding domain-containing protein n=1 Tax=Nesidiocoris tenuis TaxID=355587 RepID=A0ABN7AAT6_9HEMI|nr:RNA Hypothetical protein motif [Nesidiocoris tenuis]